MPRPVSLSLELLRTFLTLHRRDGDAALTARDLGINQPSMSKRLGYLQHSSPILPRPWLVREGKTWKLTEEGEAVLPAVEEIVALYAQLQEYVDDPDRRTSQIRFACGQTMAGTLLRAAIEAFRNRSEYAQVRLRLNTIRAEDRIKRVASGSLDLAAVHLDVEAILEIARRPLYVRPLTSERLILVSRWDVPWKEHLAKLETGKVKPKHLEGLPLLLPEPDSSPRRCFDAAMRTRAKPGQLDILLEVGGWSTLLGYVRDGLGVGVVGETAIAPNATDEVHDLVMFGLDSRIFLPMQSRLIARRLQGNPEEPDLASEARAFMEMLVQIARARTE